MTMLPFFKDLTDEKKSVMLAKAMGLAVQGEVITVEE